MKIAVLCHGTVLQPALEALFSQGLLAGVAVPDGDGDVNLQLEGAVRQSGIPFLRVSRTDVAAQLTPWLAEIAPDTALTMGFPCKIPASVLALPRFGFFNIHGGTLPHYRGPDPVFWQIRNREPCGAITIHRMTQELDAGGVAHAERVKLGQDDTYALHMQRLGAVLPRVVIEFVQQLALRGDALPLQEQDAAAVRYLPRPTDADRTIDWSWARAEIDALVRACNPLYGGALTLLKGIPLRLLETSPALPCADRQTPPGTIVSASAEESICVTCGQGEALFLDLIYSNDGFFTGRRLARIFGLQPGDRLA